MLRAIQNPNLWESFPQAILYRFTVSIYHYFVNLGTVQYCSNDVLVEGFTSQLAIILANHTL